MPVDHLMRDAYPPGTKNIQAAALLFLAAIGRAVMGDRRPSSVFKYSCSAVILHMEGTGE